MTEPKPADPSAVSFEPLIEPTANQITDRHRAALDEAPKLLPPKLDHHERGRIRAACTAARRLYPEPVSRVLVDHLMAWDEFGYRWARLGTVSPLIDHLLSPPVPVTDAA